MVFIGCTRKLKTNNYLNMFTHTFDEDLNVDKLTNQMIVKLQLIFELHKSMLGFLMNKLMCNNAWLIISEGKTIFSLFQCRH
jgi:hypothetical protein